MKICGRLFKLRLYNKGIVAIDYYNWKNFFIDSGNVVPTFDINENMPSHGVIYKKFTDTKYLSIENYDDFLFKEQCRALSTLVGYLGASCVKVKQEFNENNNKKFGADLNIMNEAAINANLESGSNLSSNSIIFFDFIRYPLI